MNFCGVSEKLLDEARRRQAQWVNKRHLKYFIADRLPGLSLQELTDAYDQAFASWAKVCGLTFERIATSAGADFLLLARSIDGASGTLAEHELPMGDDRQLRGWWDVGERWSAVQPIHAGKIDLVAVACHELGHGLGLSHTNQPKSLLNPFYNPTIRTPQGWDIDQAVARYGKPTAKPADPTPSPTIPGGPPDTAPIIIELFGAVYAGTLTRKL